MTHHDLSEPADDSDSDDDSDSPVADLLLCLKCGEVFIGREGEPCNQCKDD